MPPRHLNLESQPESSSLTLTLPLYPGLTAPHIGDVYVLPRARDQRSGNYLPPSHNHNQPKPNSNLLPYLSLGDHRGTPPTAGSRGGKGKGGKGLWLDPKQGWGKGSGLGSGSGSGWTTDYGLKKDGSYGFGKVTHRRHGPLSSKAILSLTSASNLTGG